MIDPNFEAVTTKTASEMLKISKSYLEKLRLYDREKSPPFFRIGRAVRYPVDDLRKWAESRMVGG
ncbi:MAG: hypothetical protein COA43_05930 [Robiginitomaculum sp.]|nr:MAG: hypothetical protein COA43_05930 [Robiginitomaculum sp.]